MKPSWAAAAWRVTWFTASTSNQESHQRLPFLVSERVPRQNRNKHWVREWSGQTKAMYLLQISLRGRWSYTLYLWFHHFVLRHCDQTVHLGIFFFFIYIRRIDSEEEPSCSSKRWQQDFNLDQPECVLTPADSHKACCHFNENSSFKGLTTNKNKLFLFFF